MTQKNKIIELTSKLPDNRSKAKAIYEYMQSKTRYVSIQIGIGGYQPIDANTVDKLGYGDCKALSNYMKALLSAAGINSHYVLVRAGEDAPDIFTDFPSASFNHAILCIPDIHDTIWLECTSQNAPFGYIGSFTDNRNVLLITENGGKLAKTKHYAPEINKKITHSKITIDTTGNAKINSITQFTGICFDDFMGFNQYSLEDQKKYLYKKIELPDYTISKIKYSENKSILPCAILELDIEINKFATQNDNRYFIPVTFFNKMNNIPIAVINRKSNLIFKRGDFTTDTICISIQPTLKPEFLPKNEEIVCEFGTYIFFTNYTDNQLTIIRTFVLNTGIYPPEKYVEFREFLRKISKLDNQKAVFINK